MSEYGSVRVYLEVWYRTLSGQLRKSRVTLLKTENVTVQQARGLFLDVKGMQLECDRGKVHYTFTFHG